MTDDEAIALGERAQRAWDGYLSALLERELSVVLAEFVGLQTDDFPGLTNVKRKQEALKYIQQLIEHDINSAKLAKHKQTL
jgi:hypothetical protein